MKMLSQQFLEYVTEVSGQPAAWGIRVAAQLPQYLAQRYGLFEVAVGRRWFLGITLEDATDFRPATFEKHLRQILSHASHLEGYCLIAQSLAGYVRQRLVDRKIAFVVPGQQMFWPELGLALQAGKIKSTMVPVETISPATQAVLIYALTGGVQEPVTPKFLAEKLGYAAMTLTRALDEIVTNKLGTVVRKSRERLLYPEVSKVLWGQVLPFLRDPVRETVRTKEYLLVPNFRITAGETALAGMGMLSAPKEPVYAIGRKAWKNISKQIELIPVEDEGTCQLQIWRYDPALFAKQGKVDPFSLFLSLRDEQDERVDVALTNMMEEMEWL